jgi:molybdate transport system ATP-binding protein
MDEPLAALDSYSKADILPYFDKLHEELSIPILYVSHAIEEVVRLADHLLIIEKGQIIANGAMCDTSLNLPTVP